MAIENDMCAMADHLVEKCAKSTGNKVPLIRDIYGTRWATKPKEFRFLEGEILCLLGLAEHVKMRGVDSFLKFTKSHVSQGSVMTMHKSVVLDQTLAETYVFNLVQKLKSVYLAQ